MDAVAGLEEVRHADHFEKNDRHDEREREEDAEFGFKCVSHNSPGIGL